MCRQSNAARFSNAFSGVSLNLCINICPLRHLSILLNPPAALSQLFQMIPLDDFTTPSQTNIGRATK